MDGSSGERSEGRGDGGHTVGRRTVLRSAGAVGAAGVVAPGVGAADPAARARAGDRAVGGEFVKGTTREGSDPHPLRHRDETTLERIRLLYDGPGAPLGPDSLLPLWFERVEFSDAADVVEYELREDLVWGAGYGQLTAEDYRYTLETVILPTGEEDWYGYPDGGEFFLQGPGEYVDYEKTGRYTLRAELPEPRPQWLHEDPLLGTIPLPKDLLAKYVPTRDAEGLNADEDVVEGRLAGGESTLGPYELVERTRGARWRFRRNEDYYLTDHADEEPFAGDPYFAVGDAPYFEEFVYQVFDAEETARSALELGEVDALAVDYGSVPEYRATDDVTVWEGPFGDGIFWLNLNHRINGWGPIRESREVRRALANLYHRETVVADAFDGLATPTATFHPAWGPFYPDEDRRYDPEGTVERARELLAAGTPAGYGYDERGRLVGPDGEAVVLRAARLAEAPGPAAAAGYMRDRLDSAGIDLVVEPKEYSTLLRDHVFTSVENVAGVTEGDLPDWAPRSSFNGGPWDMAASTEDWSLLFGLGLSTNAYAPWGELKATMAERGSFNYWGYRQDRYDVFETVNAAASDPDPGRTRERMAEFLGFLSRDLPVVWSQTEHDFRAYSADVEGLPGDRSDGRVLATDEFRDPDPRLLTYDAGTDPADYAGPDGVVDTDELRAAISDWATGEIGTDTLQDVIRAWATGGAGR